MMKSGEVRAYGRERGSTTPNRQMREEAFGMQMRMRAHGYLMTNAVKMELVMSMLSVMPGSLSPRARSGRMKRKKKKEKTRDEV